MQVLASGPTVLGPRRCHWCSGQMHLQCGVWATLHSRATEVGPEGTSCWKQDKSAHLPHLPSSDFCSSCGTDSVAKGVKIFHILSGSTWIWGLRGGWVRDLGALTGQGSLLESTDIGMGLGIY